MTSPYQKLEQEININTKWLKQELHHENQNDNGEDSAMDLQNQTERMTQIISKLLSKNKVSTRNAFQVPIVDVSHLKYYQSSDEGSWSKISTTLQNCSKIYAYRVDYVTENICKMSTSIARNLKQQLECKDVTKQKIQAEFFREQNYKPINISNLDLHLDKDKLDKECFKVQVKNANHIKFRRMMDQNGISGLILATVPLSKSLAVQLQPFIDSQIKMESEQNLKFDQALPSQQCNWKTIEKITKATANGINQIKEENQTTIQAFLQTIDQTKIQLSEGQYFSKDLEETDYLQPIQDQNLVIKTDKEVFHFGDKTKHKVKRQSLKSKKNQIRKSVTKEYSYCFDLQYPLQKTSILKKDQNLIKRHLNVKEIAKSNLVSIVAPHQMYFYSQNRTRMKKMLATSMREQTIIENMDFNGQMEAEKLYEDHSNNYENQNIQKEQRQIGIKCPSVKQTKIQLNNLLFGIDQILFSELFNFHRQKIGSPFQTIDFLSVLHLSNEQGLVLKEVNDYDFMISKSIA